MRRVRLGEWLAAAGGVALLVSLNLEWYWPTSGFPDLFAGTGFTGFEAFSILDVYLVLIAGLGLVLAVLQATQRSPALPVGAAVFATVLGAVAVLLVAYRIVNQPGDNEFITVRAWAWVGLAATAAVAAGAWLSLRNERVRGLPPEPETELRPPP